MGIQALNNTPTQKEVGPISSEIEPDQSRFTSMFAAVFSRNDTQEVVKRINKSKGPDTNRTRPLPLT